MATHVVAQQTLQSKGLATVGAGEGAVLLITPTLHLLPLAVVQELHLQAKYK